MADEIGQLYRSSDIRFMAAHMLQGNAKVYVIVFLDVVLLSNDFQVRILWPSLTGSDLGKNIRLKEVESHIYF